MRVSYSPPKEHAPSNGTIKPEHGANQQRHLTESNEVNEEDDSGASDKVADEVSD